MANNYGHLFPSKYNRYIEPFVGSGAMFFSLNPEKSIINDSNARLIEAYRSVSERPDLVLRHLKTHAKLHSNEHYYKTRSQKFQSKFARAAKFIYLNRTCFNGIYRENLKGEFNVPIGTKTAVILKTDNFFKTSERLRKSEVFCADFESIVNKAEKDDFLFIDPPYTVAHNCNGFIKYNQKIFTWEDQVRLKEAAARASSRGAKVFVTNADHSSIRELYSESSQLNMSRNSVIGGRGAKRNKTTELLIQV